MFALTFDGKVVQIELVEFPVHSALVWVDISAEVPMPQVGWLYDGNNFTAPPLKTRPPKSDGPLLAEELATQMITDGTMTRAKIDSIKAAR